MKRLLYVDDGESQRKLVRLVVERMDDWLILECGTAEEALDIVATTPPDIIALDIGLPGISGVETAEHLRLDKHTAAIPIIAVSGHDVEVRKSDSPTLFDAVLQKPFDIVHFKELIENVWNRSNGGL